MSTTDLGRDPAEIPNLGRILASLVRWEHKSYYRWDPSGNKYVPNKTARYSSWPHDWTELERAFGINRRTLRRIWHEWRDTHPMWTTEKIGRGLVSWMKRNKRWPKTKEWCNSNKLCAWSTFNRSQSPDAVFRYVREALNLTPLQILTIPNVTARREAVEAAGGFDELLEKIKIDSKAPIKKVADDKYGTIWHLPGETMQNPMAILEVVNQTKEPDGSHAHHFLRIPPEIRNPHQAVAWSFGIESWNWNDFRMVKES